MNPESDPTTRAGNGAAMVSGSSGTATAADPSGPAAFSLRGRRAVVTGASTGIGSAIAVALGAAGAHVAGIYKTDPDGAERTETQVREHGVDCFLLAGDTGDPLQVD